MKAFATVCCIINRRDKKMAVISVNQSSFDALVSENKKLLLDFYADWCGPCRMVAPIVHEIAEERSDIVVGKINVDENMDLAMRFGIVSIPTLIVIDKGEVVNKMVGARSKSEILAALDN